jgi:hypothetical protein
MISVTTHRPANGPTEDTDPACTPEAIKAIKVVQTAVRVIDGRLV